MRMQYYSTELVHPFLTAISNSFIAQTNYIRNLICYCRSLQLLNDAASLMLQKLQVGGHELQLLSRLLQQHSLFAA